MSHASSLPSSQPEVFLPVDLLNAMSLTSVSTVKELYKEIQQVQDESNDLHIRAIQSNRKLEDIRHEFQQRKPKIQDFHLFPELPWEIRDMIWGWAFTAPQTIIFRSGSQDESPTRFSKSSINILMQTCREAKMKGIELKFSYFISKIGRKLGHYSKSNACKNYLCPELTTIWAPDTDRFSPSKSIARDLKFYCGTCHRPGSFLKYEHKTCKHASTQRLRRLAFSAKEWRDPFIDHDADGKPWVMGTAETSWRFGGVREILIVTNNTDRTSDPNASFVTPASKIGQFQALRQLGIFDPSWDSEGCNSRSEGATWRSLAAERENLLKKFVAGRTDFRKKKIEEGLDESGLNIKYKAFDVSNWSVPSISYVEARLVEKR